MELKQALLQNPNDLLNLRALKPFPAQLWLVFAAPHFFSNSLFTESLNDLAEGQLLIGCSTAGEIAGRNVHENTAVVQGIHFEHPDFVSACTLIRDSGDSFAAGERLASQLARADVHTVLILSPGLDVNGSALIEGIQHSLRRPVKIIGGLAGDNGQFAQTFTLYQNKIDSRQVVAVGFYGPHLHCAHGSFGGWQAFGPPRKVTRAVGNQLFSLDHEAALDVYKHYLGDYAQELPGAGLLFPFAILGEDHRQTGLIRTILGIDNEQGSLTLAGDISENSYVRLMHASTDSLIDGAQAAAKATQTMLMQTTPGLPLLISCVGRRMVMGARVDEEVEAVAETFGNHCQPVGFYSYGEISPFLDSTDCRLHNQTMTISYLYEAPAGAAA
ncbi:FIST signal transduction protein [Parvibium lacunae]|uniref:Histidine kinase n=1 Tax=Parvibium lacunae TaxID=1888893 RepID=A0A368L7U5_9BURK|nr:FIST N-terminal domain-containing protein [Parvibium lacunae]RCS59696.1 hypothetical protein DU000_03035 [Parvibium lacunae]